MKYSRLRLLLIAGAITLALLALTRPQMATALSGGSLSVPISAVVTGGLRSTGGSRVNYSSIGAYGTVMTGGSLKMISGALGSVKTARLNTNDAHAYPTPFMPSKGHDRITFTQLPALVTIKIFSLSGRPVITLEKNDSTDSYIWSPVVNSQGTSLASGVYLFHVIQPGISKRQGKFMVIK